MSLQTRDKAPSKEILVLIRQSIKILGKFGELWKQVQEKGYAEGFDDKELQDLARPFLKQRLTTAQIKHLFDSNNKKSEN